MAQPGWYPDPGDPSRLRYFDGQQWTATTRSPGGPPGPTRTAGTPRRTGLVVAAAAVVVLILVVVGAVRLLQGPGEGAAPEPGASTSVSAWDDSSPTTRPEPSPSGSVPQVPCTAGGADQLGDPAGDGRVHGGPLSFAALSGRWDRARSTSRWFFARDSWVQIQPLPEKLGWQASAQVGVVDATLFPGGYPGSAPTARVMLDCLVDSDFYTSVAVRETGLRVRPVTIGTTAATRLDVTLDFSHPQLKTKGSRIVIVVVDSAPATYYFHAVPKERSDLIAELDAAIASLRVD